MFENIKSFSNKIVFKIEGEVDENNNLPEDEGVISVSILSEDMLLYDEAVFQYLQEAGNSDNSLGSIPANRLPEELSQKYSIRMDVHYRPYFIEFQIPLVELKTHQILYRMFDGVWRKGEVTSGQGTVNEQSQEAVVKGFLMTSASPVRFENAELHFTDDKLTESEMKRIENAYNTKKSIKAYNEIGSQLSNLLDEAIDFKIEAFNVGDANCIYVTNVGTKKKHKFYFDIGYHYSKTLPISSEASTKRYSYAEACLANRKPDGIILSHWDLDHILGCVYANNGVFEVPWVAPDLNAKEHEGTINAKRLARYLEVKGNLYLAEIGYKNPDYISRQVLYENDKVSVGRANGKALASSKKIERAETGEKGYKRLTKINNTGIIISIKGEDGYTVLAGDAEYGVWPECIRQEGVQCNYLLVPHHASKMRLATMPAAKTNQGRAIVCASGEKEVRPYNEHMVGLQKAGFVPVLTGDRSTAVWIDSVMKSGGLK